MIFCLLDVITTSFDAPSAQATSEMQPRRIPKKVTRHWLKAPPSTSTLPRLCSIVRQNGWCTMNWCSPLGSTATTLPRSSQSGWWKWHHNSSGLPMIGTFQSGRDRRGLSRCTTSTSSRMNGGYPKLSEVLALYVPLISQQHAEH